MARRITLRSPLTPVALATKLRDTLGDKDDAPKAGVCGHGSEEDMMLFVYRPNIQNSFATNLTAKMETDGLGTKIAGKIGTPGSAIVFIAIWCGFLGLFLAGALFAMAMLPGEIGEMWPMVVVPLGMMGFGLLLYRFGTLTAKKDEAAILRFLADTVQAREI